MGEGGASNDGMKGRCGIPSPHLRANRLGDVPKRIDRGSADGLLVRPEHLEQLKADAHPLAGRDERRAAVSDTPDEVDAVLLHLLVPVLEHGREAWQKLLDRRRHLRG